MAHLPRILLLGKLPVYEHDQWADFLKDFEVIPADVSSRDEFKAKLKDGSYGQFEGILKLTVEYGNEPAPWDEEMVALLPSSVKIFAAAGAGYDTVKVPLLTERKIVYCNSRGAGETATSDIALFLLLATFRLTSLAEWAARSGDPEIFDKVHNEMGAKAVNPQGRLLGCLGLGAIQKELVRKAGKTGLGMRVVYYDPFRLPEETEKSLGVEYVPTLDALASAGCDCISVSVPYSEVTHHVVDKNFFQAMKPGSRLINTSRGRTVEEDALVEALESGHLLSAGLDVHYNEPVVSKRLIALKTVTLLPHIGGVAQDTLAAFERISMTNITNFLKLGEPLLSAVNKLP